MECQVIEEGMDKILIEDQKSLLKVGKALRNEDVTQLTNTEIEYLRES